MRRRGHIEDLGVDVRVILNRYLRSRMRPRTALMFFRVGAGGGLL